MNEALKDKVVLIAGATGALGRVVARELAGDGALLALFGTQQERLRSLAAELNLDADRTLLHAADLRDEAAADAAVAAVIERFGRLNVLIQAVGGWTGGQSVTATSPHDFRAMLDQHVWTTINLLRAAIPPMSAAAWGRIIAVSAPAAVEAPARSAAYAGAKAAEETILRAAAHELEGSGVTVNVIVVRAIGGEAPAAGEPRGKRASTTPEEIVEAIRYLCSDAAASINGARLPLYGG